MLGPRGIISISEAIKKNQKLEVLNLADNCFGHDMASILALKSGLEENSTLKNVNLHLNSMIPEGVSLLLAVLKTKNNIQEFKIFERIDKEVFTDLLDTIKSHKTVPAKGKKKGKGKKKK